MAAETSDETRAEDGTGLHYRIRGADGAPHRFVLIHSLAMTGDFWTAVAEALGPDVQVLAPDCRGHGRSDKPAGPYTVESCARDVLRVMDAAGWRDAFLAGASMGGSIAIALAGLAPERLRGLGLIDTTAWYGETAAADWEERAVKAREAGLAALVGFQQTRWFTDAFRDANPEAVQDAVAVFLANDTEAYVESCRMLGRLDLRAALRRFDFPVEIAVGSEDYATPVGMAEAMAAAIPGAALTVLEGRRHLTPLESPVEIAELLRRLIARAERG